MTWFDDLDLFGKRNILMRIGGPRNPFAHGHGLGGGKAQGGTCRKERVNNERRGSAPSEAVTRCCPIWFERRRGARQPAKIGASGRRSRLFRLHFHSRRLCRPPRRQSAKVSPVSPRIAASPVTALPNASERWCWTEIWQMLTALYYWFVQTFDWPPRGNRGP